MKKRFLSLMLTMAMCVGLISGFCVTAYATDKTQEEAIEWVKQQEGKALSYSGTNSPQCVDLIKFYYEFLGEEHLDGHAYEYETNALPEGWTRTKGGVPQPGDILVYSKRADDDYGHVAIYESDESIYHQNFGYPYVIKTAKKYSDLRNNTYWGCIHPNFRAPIELGDYVQMGTYYGEPILWRCVAFEKISGYDEAGYPIIDSTDTVTEYQDGYLPLLLSDKIICLKPYDAATSANSGTGSHSRSSYGSRSYGGSNCWYDSNIRSWLNSDAYGVDWICGNPPLDTYVHNGYNDYAFEAGFLTNFTDDEVNAINAVTQKSIVSASESGNGVYDSGSELHQYGSYKSGVSDIVKNYANAYAMQTTDKIFLLDVEQLHTVYANSNVLGSNYYIGTVTEQCVNNSEYTAKTLTSGAKWDYWLRTPDTDTFYSGDACYEYTVRCVYSNGNVMNSFPGGESAYDGDIGVRPACYLSNVSLKGEGTVDNPYKLAGISVYLDGKEIQFDQPPVMVDDRVMVPIRAILEAMGYIVSWDEETQTASALGGSTYIVIQVDNNIITYTRNADTYTYECDVPPQVISDRTLVPIRAVAECLGCTVEWDDASQNVIITSAN